LTVVVICVGAGIAYLCVRRNAEPHVTIPKSVIPSPNAFDYFRVAATSAISPSDIKPALGTPPRYRQPTAPQASPPPPSTPAILAIDRRAFAFVDQGMRYPFLAPPLRTIGPRPSYVSGFRRLGRAYAFAASQAASRGQWGDFARLSENGLRFAVKSTRGGASLNDRTAEDVEGDIREAMWSTVDKAPSSTAKRIAASVEALDPSRTSMVDILTEEKWYSTACLLEYTREMDWREQFINDDANALQTEFDRMRMRLKLAPVVRQELIDDHLRWMDAQISAARGPYGTKPIRTPMNATTGMFVGDTALPVADHAANVAQDRMLATAYALRAYHLDHGAYPGRLDALTPVYLKQVPLDPFTTRATLRYRTTAKGYLLYSIGPDGIDDGGKSFDNGERSNEMRYWVEFSASGDVVAGVNRGFAVHGSM